MTFVYSFLKKSRRIFFEDVKHQTKKIKMITKNRVSKGKKFDAEKISIEKLLKSLGYEKCESESENSIAFFTREYKYIIVDIKLNDDGLYSISIMNKYEFVDASKVFIGNYIKLEDIYKFHEFIDKSL